MIIKQLLVEGQTNTLGIDVKEPLLSWQFSKASKRSAVQEAYRIVISTDKNKLAGNHGTVWDTGKIKSRRNVNIIYKGEPLASKTTYYWKVLVWDDDGRQTESNVGWWETGLMYPEDWTGKWLSAKHTDGTSLPLFRHEFTLEKQLDRARLYICGLGHYEVRLNGSKVADRVLEPGWTHYDKTCFYSAYDVSDYLVAASRNAIGVVLGNGFYHVEGGRYTKFKNSFGELKCLIQLEVTYTDGTVNVIKSNHAWHTSPGPVTFSCIYGGEDYNANQEHTGWDQPDFVYNTSWADAAEVEPPAGKLVAQKNPPLKVMKTFKAASIKKLDHGKYLVDFGQNMSGWVEITVEGQKNSVVKMVPAEILHENGTPNQSWSGSPHNYHYTLKGIGTETWSPSFTYYGFRYLQIEGAAPDHFDDSSSVKLLDIKGQMIYPDIETSGFFHTSDTLINRIHENINWAILSNMKSIFTDCPHREKLGWLEQVHLMGPSVLFNYDCESLFTKVMADIGDAQLSNGMVPTTAPEYVVFEKPWDIFRHSASWGAAYVIGPWQIYEKYGNDKLMADHYDGMRRYIDYLCEESDGYILTDGLGDWYDVGGDGPGFAQNTPVALADTAMFYHIVDIFTKITKLVKGNQEHSDYYEALCSKIKKAFNESFFAPEMGYYGTGSQSSNAMPLAMGLVEDEYRERVFHNLVNDIVKHDYHTTAGDIGHRYVLQALSEYNQSDIIFKMSQKKDYPSYGYQVDNGATTLTEAWDGPAVGKSQNHFMLGHIEEWFYEELAGIHYAFNPQSGAYHFTIKPYFPDELTYVKAGNQLLAGNVKSEWEKINHNQIRLHIEIPVNSEADVFIPATSAEAVTENGESILNSKHIIIKNVAGGFIQLGIGSGQYDFMTTA